VSPIIATVSGSYRLLVHRHDHRREQSVATQPIRNVADYIDGLHQTFSALAIEKPE
jgi:hypothetical protein